MATEKMYELAFQYKGTKLWHQLYDDELFAVRLTDGEIGYCCVMGRLGELNALGLYVGDEGYQSYHLLRRTDHENMTDRMMGELLTSQNCLQCSFDSKAMLSDEELDEVHRYAQAHGKTLRGKNAFPQFTKYRAGRFPWRCDSALDEQRICDALSAAVALKKLLQKHDKAELGLVSLEEDPAKIPMLVLEDSRWIIRFTALPSAEIRYPEPLLTNEVTAARIRRKAKTGVWECGTFWLPDATQEEGHEDEAPRYPLALLLVDLGSGLVQPPIVTDGEAPSEMLDKFVQLLLDGKSLPRTIRCGDDRAFSLLKDLCTKTGIRLERTEEPEALDEVIDELLEHLSGPEEAAPSPVEIAAMEDVLMQMSDDELRRLPQEMVNMLFSLAEYGALPEALSARVKKLFRKK